MLRSLGKTENVINFQELCGLSSVSRSLDYTTKLCPQCYQNTMTNGNTYSYQTNDGNIDLNKNNADIGQQRNENNTKKEKKKCKECFNIKNKEEEENKAESHNINNNKFKSNYFIHKIFDFGSELGNEAFYITFLPFVFWNVDDYIARRLIVLWVFTMYTGQGLKDILCWPRPPSPPVFRWESTYENEYGMPSTHAISGSIIPFGLVYFSYGRFDYNLVYGIFFFIAWTTLVCLSRVYKGMHTFQDLLAGLSVSAFITALWLPYLDLSLEMFLSKSNAWIFILLVPILMIYVFPTKCMETRNDTATIIAVGCGCMLAAWTDYYIEGVPLPDPYKDAPRPIISTNVIAWFLFSASRFIIGIAILIPIKIALKLLINNLGFLLMSTGSKVSDRQANDSLTLPYYFITYSTIGYSAVYVAPRAFEFVGLIL